MFDGSSRRGLAWLPLASLVGVIRQQVPVPPAPCVLSELITLRRVPGRVERLPEVLAAFGYVPK